MKYFLFILTFILLSCNDTHTVHVKVTNPVTGSGAEFEGVTYVVREQRVGLLQTHFKDVHTGVLDENGEDFFEIKLKEKNRKYFIIMETPTDLCYSDPDKYHLSFDSTNMHAHFDYLPCAYLKFRYSNSNCFDTNDRIIVHRYTNLDNYSGFSVDAEYEGCAEYTMPQFIEVPMGWWYFEWTVEKNSNTTDYSDSVFLEAGEQLFYEFIY